MLDFVFVFDLMIGLVFTLFTLFIAQERGTDCWRCLRSSPRSARRPRPGRQSIEFALKAFFSCKSWLHFSPESLDFIFFTKPPQVFWSSRFSPWQSLYPSPFWSFCPGPESNQWIINLRISIKWNWIQIVSPEKNGLTFDEGDSSLGEPSSVLNPESVSIVSNLQVSIISILDFLSDLSFKTF